MSSVFSDPAFTPFLSATAHFRAPSALTDSVALMRKMRSAAFDPSVLYSPNSYRLLDATASSPNGTTAIRIAVPVDTAVMGLVVSLHGGGLISGTVNHGLAEARPLALPGTAVIAVEYRIAPESSYADAVEDCVRTVIWAREHGAELGAFPNAPIVLAGSSAGGALAIATAAMLREQEHRGTASGLLLSAPMIDPSSTTPSMRLTEGVGTWDRGWNRQGWSAALRTPADVALVPSRLDLTGMPPTYLDVGSADALRDEVIQYACRSADGGVETELHIWAGGFHGFEWAVPEASVSRTSMEMKQRWLRKTFAEHGAPEAP